MSTGLETYVVDAEALMATKNWFRESGVRLPRISQLANPSTLKTDMACVDPDAPDPRNLFRVHWFNGADRTSRAAVPEHIVLPPELTGVMATIIVALGNRFPLIRAHKVLTAYGCLVPRLITGGFDPTRHRAIWPSTGNYCRGGVAISRIMGCRSAAVLPEGMSRERFQWLENWVTDQADIIRTCGTESNVKEIYDACNDLAQDRENVILNQFREFGNYIIHRAVTGPALEAIFNAVQGTRKLKARAFISASGSAGTLAAGDYLKARLGADIGAVEAIECPTLLYNGFGEHNIQGIGDKHVPLIHNVMNTDYVIGISDAASDALNLLFNTSSGRGFLAERTSLGQEFLGALADLGLSAIANVLGAIKLAKYANMDAEDVILTVATDGSEMYGTEQGKAILDQPDGRFDTTTAAEIYGRYILGIATDHLLETSRRDRERIFNLGYYTWVEQQGVDVPAFEVRREQSFWDSLMSKVPQWDAMIDDFNSNL